MMKDSSIRLSAAKKAEVDAYQKQKQLMMQQQTQAQNGVH